MKVRISVLGAFLIATAIALNAAAQAAQQHQVVVTGEVMKVDAAKRTITLRKTSLKTMKPVYLTLAPDATIWKGSEKIELNKLTAGQKVTAGVIRQKGVMTARDIRLQIGAAYTPAPYSSPKG
jgi:Cu/Ag efflux protein CusF